jgi:hypothetical protein
VVGALCAQLTVDSIKRECGSERVPARFHRVEVKVRAAVFDVEGFHSARGGYRAQYYVDPTVGEAANRYVLDQFVPLLKPMVEERCSLAWDWIGASRAQPTAKVWIHQGSWARQQPIADGVLSIARWSTGSKETKVRKTARLASLAPATEDRLRVLGGWITLDSRESFGTAKPTRSQDLHDFGWT